MKKHTVPQIEDDEQRFLRQSIEAFKEGQMLIHPFTARLLLDRRLEPDGDKYTDL